jgi:sugar O-acyltransferase (sialic acid O-acetyltransferase NeuD family)
LKKKIVFFGAGKVSEVIAHYFDQSTDFEIVAFACDKAFRESDSFLGRPLYDFDSAFVERFPPSSHGMFVGIGYQDLNQLRAERCELAQSFGYNLVSYIGKSSTIVSPSKIGVNVLIMDGATVQPRVEIGDNSFIWGGSLISHHSRVGKNVWVTSGAQVAGSVTIGDNCFLGVNCTVGHNVQIGKDCFIGAGALVNKSVEDDKVIIEKPTEHFRLSSRRFLKVFGFN